jgi:hypothetical protein
MKNNQNYFGVVKVYVLTILNHKIGKIVINRNKKNVRANRQRCFYNNL